MSESAFPKKVEDVLATLADIYKHQNQPDIVELLEAASARIEQTNYDNWDGGTYTYGLMLDIPVPIFAAIEIKISEIEKSISSKLGAICRNLGNHHLDSVTITPLTLKSASLGPKTKPADAEVKHIWREGYFRLFLSHVSAHKMVVAKLKIELQIRGISAFVAHEDIAPSLEWQNEIELALRSMHALAALLTPDFHQSSWTDQEVGFALGKGVLVVPVRLGTDPYGFIAKVQGLSGSLEHHILISSLLSTTLLNHPSTHRDMRKATVAAFAAADSYNNSIALSRIIATIKDFTKEEKMVLQRACKENDQIFNATGVVARVYSAIGVPILKKATDTDEDVPF